MFLINRIARIQSKPLATDDAIVSGDINGKGRADFQIEVQSANALRKDDFVF
jgi:hypothetical protein